MKLTRPSISIVARWLLILSLITVPSLALGQKTKSAPAPAAMRRPCRASVGARLAPKRRRRLDGQPRLHDDCQSWRDDNHG